MSTDGFHKELDKRIDRRKMIFKKDDFLKSTFNNNGHSESIIINLANHDNIYKVDSVHEYSMFINDVLLKYSMTTKKRNRTLFRGLNNILVIKSKLYFEQYQKKKSNDSKDYENVIFEKECKYIKKFEENGSLKLKGYNTVNELIACAKHYELNTRFIDWTHSPLVATLFAISEEAEISLNNEKSKYYCVLFRSCNNSIIFNDLPYYVSEIKINDYYLNNDLDLLNSAEIQKFLDEFNSQYKSSIIQPNYRYAKYSKAMKLYNDVNNMINKLNNNIKLAYSKNYSPTNVFEFLEDSKLTNREKASLLIIYKYCETIYQLTNYNFDYKNKGQQQVIFTMVQKMIAKNSKVFLETVFCNDRLRSQRGLFEIDTYESFQRQFDDSKNKFLLIKQTAKKEIIKHINALGINYYMLMDEPYNCSKIINDTMKGKYSFSNNLEYDNK